MSSSAVEQQQQGKQQQQQQKEQEEQSSCQGPHSLISELTRGAAVGPVVYRDCNGCMRGSMALESQHFLAMSDFDIAALRSIPTGDVKAQPMSVEEAASSNDKVDPMQALGNLPYCSKATKRSASGGRC